MITTIIFIIGVLFILNGITTMGHSRVVGAVRAGLPVGSEIYFGGSKGLLFLSSTDVLIAVRENGKIAKAFCIKSGWLRKSKSEDLKLDGCKMEKIENHTAEMNPAQQRACLMALRQYTKRRK